MASGFSGTFGTRRRHPRIPVTLEIRSTQATTSIPFTSKDLSGAGLFLHGTRIYPIGAELTLEFEIPYSGRSVKAKARVVRHGVEPDTGLINGMGLEFLDRSDEIAGLIEEYLTGTDAG